MSATRRPSRLRLLGRSMRRTPRIGLRGVAALAVGLAILAGAFLWLRQSSLVAVRKVTIVGVAGPDAGAVRAALTSAARQMTTLDVDHHRLRAAVATYPVVRDVRAATHFPHGMRITVSEQVPVAYAVAGGQRTAVSGDGLLLRQGAAGAVLPTISLSAPPGGTRLTGAAVREAELLAAAPYQLLSRVASATESSAHGLSVSLRDGPVAYFGDSGQLVAKWDSLVEVLADSSSAGASYIDLTDPSRPAAGTGSDAATAPATSSATTPQTATETTPGVTTGSAQTTATTGDSPAP